MGQCIYARKGFKIIEFLIAAAIVLLLIGGALAIYTMCLTAWKEGSEQIALQREASISMEMIIRGVGLGTDEIFGMDGIREGSASSVTRPNS